MTAYICGPSRGRYGRLYRVAGPRRPRWVDDDGEPRRPPRTLSCEYPRHAGRRRRFPMEQCYWQRLRLTRAEVRAAMRDWDVFSLDVSPRIVCPECARLPLEERDR